MRLITSNSSAITSLAVIRLAGGVNASVSPAGLQGTVVPASNNVQMMLPQVGQGDQAGETTDEEPVATSPTMPVQPVGQPLRR